MTPREGRWDTCLAQVFAFHNLKETRMELQEWNGSHASGPQLAWLDLGCLGCFSCKMEQIHAVEGPRWWWWGGGG